jgi:hypothetical protein
LEQRLLSVIPIAIGLVVEWLALWLGGFGLSWKRAGIVDIGMNAVSTVVGIVLIPALGFAWELFPGSIIYPILHVGTFNPVTWGATLVLAVVATTLVEFATVRWAFRIRLNIRRFAIILAANGASVGIAFWSLWRHPPKL